MEDTREPAVCLRLTEDETREVLLASLFAEADGLSDWLPSSLRERADDMLREAYELGCEQKRADSCGCI